MRRRFLHTLAQAAARPLACPPSAPARAAGLAADAIIVLGAGLDARAEMTAASRERVDAAAALWRLQVATRVVVTGGKTRGAARSEAEVMGEGLLARGVPAEALLLEPLAMTTRDNAQRCAELLLSDARSTAPPVVWLVTQPFHGRRARWLFQKAGFAPMVWHIVDSLQYRDPGQALQWTVREYLAWAKALTLR